MPFLMPKYFPVSRVGTEENWHEPNTKIVKITMKNLVESHEAPLVDRKFPLLAGAIPKYTPLKISCQANAMHYGADKTIRYKPLKKMPD